MSRLASLIECFARDEDGATLIEYGLMAALIAVGAIAAFTALGGGLQNLFGSGAGETLDGATNSLNT